MPTPYSTRRKIDPTRGAKLPDGTPNDNDRVEIGPLQLAFSEWRAAGPCPRSGGNAQRQPCLRTGNR